MAFTKTFNGSTEDGYGTTSGVNKTATTMLVGAGSSSQQDLDTKEFHSFMFFDTSSLPDNCVVITVKLNWRVTSFAGSDRAITNKVYIGSNTIGSTLEAADYGDTITNGVLLGSMTLNTAGAKTLSSSSSVITGEVNLTGYTNIEMDAYWNSSIGPSSCMITIATQDNGTSAYRPTLEVTYEIPQIISVNII